MSFVRIYLRVLGLLPAEIGGLSGGFWSFMEKFDVNRAGFVIVGMFVITWAIALSIWRFGHIEERWSANLEKPTATG